MRIWRQFKKEQQEQNTKLRMSLGSGGESNKTEVTWAEWEQGGCKEMSSERESGGRSGRASRTMCGGHGNVSLRSLAARTFFTDSSGAALLYSPLLAQTPRSLPMTETVGEPFESIWWDVGLLYGKTLVQGLPINLAKAFSEQCWNLKLGPDLLSYSPL